MQPRVILERLAESDGHVVIRGRDGRVYEGWILEVGADSLVFECAPSPFYAQATGADEMAPPPFTLALAAIAAYMDDAGRWRDLPP